MIKMRKELEKLDILEKKLKIENIERCLNCKSFLRCKERKEDVVVCEHYKEVPVKQQLVIVKLSEYEKLHDSKNKSLCSFC